MSYNCQCVGAELPGRAGPNRTVLGAGSNRLGAYEITADAGCKYCGGTGDVPDVPAGSKCAGCGEAERAVLSADFPGRVLCANCTIKAARGITLPHDARPLAGMEPGRFAVG